MKKGFTLVEVLLAAFVAVVVGALLVGILVNNSGFFYKQNAIISEGMGLNDSVRKIEDYIRQALSVAAGYPEASPVFTSGEQTLVLKIPALSPTGILVGVYDFVVVTKDQSNPKILTVKVFPDGQSQRPGAGTVLTVLLDSIEFKFMDKSGNIVAPAQASSVGVTLKILARTGAIGSSRETSIVTTLRNN